VAQEKTFEPNRHKNKNFHLIPHDLSLILDFFASSLLFLWCRAIEKANLWQNFPVFTSAWNFLGSASTTARYTRKW
jgi:hypothetical protein